MTKEKELSVVEMNQILIDAQQGKDAPSIKGAAARRQWPKALAAVKEAREKGLVIQMVNEWPEI